MLKPSVLKPTFEFVKAKVQKGIDVSDWSFSEWRDENLEIELEDGTSVLNIAYRDTDVDLVLPVIERISNDYQLYSGRDRQRGLTKGVSYLNKQVLALRTKANLSMRKAQAYALTHGLGLQDGMPTTSGANSAGTSVEASREQAQQRDNALQQQQRSAKSVDNRSIFQAPQLSKRRAVWAIANLEAELLQKQTLLKPNDDSIRRLNDDSKTLSPTSTNKPLAFSRGAGDSQIGTHRGKPSSRSSA